MTSSSSAIAAPTTSQPMTTSTSTEAAVSPSSVAAAAAAVTSTATKAKAVVKDVKEIGQVKKTGMFLTPDIACYFIGAFVVEYRLDGFACVLTFACVLFYLFSGWICRCYVEDCC